MKAYTVYTYIERVYIILLCSIAGTACGGQLSVNNINNIARTVTDLLHPTIYTENSSIFERKLRKCFLICTWKRYGYLFKYCTTPKKQGREFDHRFFDRIARFWWSKDQWDRFLTVDRRANFKDQRQRFAHGRVFLKDWLEGFDHGRSF